MTAGARVHVLVGAPALDRGEHVDDPSIVHISAAPHQVLCLEPVHDPGDVSGSDAERLGDLALGSSSPRQRGVECEVREKREIAFRERPASLGLRRLRSVGLDGEARHLREHPISAHENAPVSARGRGDEEVVARDGGAPTEGLSSQASGLRGLLDAERKNL